MTQIYYLCPDVAEACGGVRVIYRHVDILNAHGFDAQVLHHEPGFRCSWFEHQTRIAYMPRTVQPDDVLVYPEVFGPDIAEYAPGVRKVVFVQGAYLTFQNYTFDPNDMRTPYTHPDVLEAMVVSIDTYNYLRYVFPGLKIVRISPSIDPILFPLQTEKKKQIAFMSRRNAEDALQVINILKQRKALNGWTIFPIQHMSQSEVSAVLQESAIFLSLGTAEGCPLPPMEAMACGCIVIGYNGRGGREYMRPWFCRPIKTGDIIEFARMVEKMTRDYEAKPGVAASMGTAASHYIRDHYSPEREEKGVVGMWKDLLGK